MTAEPMSPRRLQAWQLVNRMNDASVDARDAVWARQAAVDALPPGQRGRQAAVAALAEARRAHTTARKQQASALLALDTITKQEQRA